MTIFAYTRVVEAFPIVQRFALEAMIEQETNNDYIYKS